MTQAEVLTALAELREEEEAAQESFYQGEIARTNRLSQLQQHCQHITSRGESTIVAAFWEPGWLCDLCGKHLISSEG